VSPPLPPRRSVQPSEIPKLPPTTGPANAPTAAPRTTRTVSPAPPSPSPTR
jgi:hypothetical protein